ncbi:ABC transporter permease [Acutalibacter intestini]|uniref:ABC transporter permease n=1 Tax=Acutalibacter intestini TaxID=3093659 RepID=UPI002AC92256|nr:ABC transporter permease [Acutalibacter sp. M00204]
MKALLAKKQAGRKFPRLAAAVLGSILFGCLFAELLSSHDPTYMDLSHCALPPGPVFLFGTDAMGRDIFSMIWSGGRVSLFIGLTATAVSTGAAVVFGTACGCAPSWLNALLTRTAELLLSVPSLLAVVFLQAILGQKNPLALAFVLGLTSWPGMAKLVATEVLRIRGSEFVVAARALGSGFFRVLGRHLAPNFLPSILFMAVMEVRSAMMAEATLSFMGLGLPPEFISWGGMLSLAEKTPGDWWVVVIPGLFLTATLLCVTSLGNWLREGGHGKMSNL